MQGLAVKRTIVVRLLNIRSSCVSKCGLIVKGTGGVSHSDCAAHMARGDEGDLARRARQQEFEFYDRAIRDTDEGGANRKKEEHAL